MSYVNGPVVVIRLEGKINNIKKIIYLFGDIHYPKNEQTKCEKNYIDFVKYLKTNILNNEYTVDFFFELGPLFNHTIIPKINKKHIDNIAHYFINTIKNKKHKPKDNKKTSDDSKKQNNNLRLHYVDYRDFLKNRFNNILKNLKNNIISKKKDIEIIKILKSLKDEYNINIQKIISKDISENNSDSINIDNFMYKIFVKYSNEKVKNILLNSFIIEEIENMSHNFNKSVDYFIDNIKTIDKITIFKKIDRYSFKTYSYIIDIYFLRRFLDKSYITHGVVYMGVYHVLFYVYILVKYFNFNITHISNNGDIKELNNIIKNNIFTNEHVSQYIRKFNLQCSDVEHFPENFL